MLAKLRYPMTTPPEHRPKPPNINEAIQEEALRVARRVQKPDQTKEQTKLIAQGIAKGIDLYKKEQSAKARERDKARKRALKQKQADTVTEHAGPADAAPGVVEAAGSAHTAWLAGGTLFAVMAGAHLLRVLAGWRLIVGPWDVPDWASLAAAALLAGLAYGFFHYAAASRRRPSIKD